MKYFRQFDDFLLKIRIQLSMVHTIIPVLQRLKQQVCKSEVSLAYKSKFKASLDNTARATKSVLSVVMKM